MPRPRKLYLGPFQPDLEARLAEEIAAYKKANGPLAPLTIVVPTHLLGLHLRRKLAPHANIRFETRDSLLNIPAAPRLGLELLCRRLAKSCDDYFAPVSDTTGFAGALLETFKNLEQAGLPKFTVKTKKLRELAAAYKAYREILPLPAIEAPRVKCFLYGFYDLTNIQKQFVEGLAPDAVFFPAVERADFSRPLLDWFGGSVPKLQRSNAPTILSAPGEPAEVREAFRSVLRYVSKTGKTFNDCAMLCRTREQYDAIVRDTTVALGLPVYFRGGRPLAEHPDAKLLLLLLEVLRSDFSRAAMMELANHIGPHSQWDARTVELGIISGKTQWQRAGRDRGLSEFVSKVFAVADATPARGTWPQFVKPVLDAFRTLGGQHTGVIQAVEALGELDAFESPVTFETFAEFCQKAIDAGREPAGQFQGGGIFFGDVMSVRGLSFDFVVVLGMVEKSFPRLIREDPLLLDDERALLGLPLKRAGYDEEVLLFDLACATAKDKLVLSFPRLEAGSGRPRMPSHLIQPLIDEKMRVVPLKPFADVALDARDFDLALLDSKTALPRALAEEISPHLAAGLEAERQRWSEPKLTTFDGVVPAAGRKPDASPTQLEMFAFCPFKYFNRHVLGIERWEEPEQLWEAEPAEVGQLAHRILERVFREKADLEPVATEEFARFEHEKVTGLPAVWAWRRATLLRDLRVFLVMERERATDGFTPGKFEYRFEKVALDVPLQIAGRIDWVDFDETGRRARIIDYKTGKAYHTKDDALEGGEALQLPLYALAAEKLLGVRVVSSEYAYLTAKGGYRRVAFSEQARQDREEELCRILRTLAAMMAKGVFAQHTGHGKCAQCDYRLICGNAVETLADRKRGDPQLKGFFEVKEIK
jgi:ATP-dependent helicase/nuclease subunit B